MRIVVISTPIFKFFETGVSGYSGLEHLAWQQAKGLAAKGHNVALVCPDGSVCPGVEIIAVGPERQVDETTAYQRYWESLLSADVIIDSTWLKWSYCLKAEGRLKSPILAVMHAPISTMYEQWPPIFPGLPQVEKACAVCISKDQANRFEVKHNAEARVCYNGIDPEYYRDLGIPRSDRFLFLARFSTIKGPDIALKACKEIGAGLDCIGDTQITGEPDYLAKCKAMADGKQLRILGGASRGECVWWFNQANCLVHPNKHFCHLPGQKVSAAEGSKLIEDVQAGDRVWSHDGQLHQVKDVFKRWYSGDVVEIQHSSFQGRLKVTLDHPVWSVRPRVCACMGETGGAICKPTFGGYEECKELTNKTIERQAKYGRVLEKISAGANYVVVAKEEGIGETTAFYWKTGRTQRPSRDLAQPYCDSYAPIWTPAEGIQEGDLVVTPVPNSIDLSSVFPALPVGCVKCDGGFRKEGAKKQTAEFPDEIQLSDDFLSLCGWYLAEGYENYGHARFALNRDEVDHAEEIRQKAMSVLGSKSSIYQAKDAHCQVVMLGNRIFGSVMKAWFGGNARVKHMPEWLFSLPPDKLRHVVRSMWRGDGCKVKSGGYESMSYTTASPSLAMQLWLTLTKFGIVSYVIEKKTSMRSYAKGKIGYNINVRGDYAQKLAKIVGWELKDNRRSSGSWKGMTYIHNGLIYSRVSDVKKYPYEGVVHNLEVEGSHSYLAQLIASHNCEPFGLAPVEAMACGTPVVSWRYGAMKETIVEGETGWTVKSYEEFVDRLRQIQKDGIPDTMRKRCRQWAADNFSVKRMVDRYDELIKEAVDAPW